MIPTGDKGGSAGGGRGRNELVRILWGGKGVWGWRERWKRETGELCGASVGCKGGLGGESASWGGGVKRRGRPREWKGGLGVEGGEGG